MLRISRPEKAGDPRNHTNTPRPDIEHWWAVEAMIASYNHVYQVIYKTKYETHGPIGISVYDGAPIASFQYEFLALSADVTSVMEAVLAYPIPPKKQYIIDVFHAEPANPVLKQHFARCGYEFIRTGPILGMDLPHKIRAHSAMIHKVTTINQAEIANHSLTAEGERIYLETLLDKNIHSFYINSGGEAVGWLQLVTIYPQVGYINQLYVLEAYRKHKLGTTLVRHAHAEALKLGLKKLVLIPSTMAIPLYRRLGYRPLLYFSAFRPKRS
jgi:GNAT superfamily N-acetyltransferase